MNDGLCWLHVGRFASGLDGFGLFRLLSAVPAQMITIQILDQFLYDCQNDFLFHNYTASLFIFF